MTGSPALSEDNTATLAKVEGQVGDLVRTVDRFVASTDQRFEKVDQRFDRNERSASEATLRVDEKLTDLLVAVNAAKADKPKKRKRKDSDGTTESMKERYAGYFITIAVAAVGGFLTYVHGNIEGSITDNKNAVRDLGALVASQSKTALEVSTALGKAINDQSTAQASALTAFNANLTSAIATSSKTSRDDLKETIKDLVPRPELDNRIDGNKAEIERKVDKDVFAKAADMRDDQIRALREELARIRADLVSRAEHAEHWKDTQDRLNINSERILSLSKEVNGAGIADQLKALQSEISALQQRAVQH